MERNCASGSDGVHSSPKLGCDVFLSPPFFPAPSAEDLVCHSLLSSLTFSHSPHSSSLIHTFDKSTTTHIKRILAHHEHQSQGKNCPLGLFRRWQQAGLLITVLWCLKWAYKDGGNIIQLSDAIDTSSLLTIDTYRQGGTALLYSLMQTRMLHLSFFLFLSLSCRGCLHIEEWAIRRLERRSSAKVILT